MGGVSSQCSLRPENCSVLFSPFRKAFWGPAPECSPHVGARGRLCPDCGVSVWAEVGSLCLRPWPCACHLAAHATSPGCEVHTGSGHQEGFALYDCKPFALLCGNAQGEAGCAGSPSGAGAEPGGLKGSQHQETQGAAHCGLRALWEVIDPLLLSSPCEAQALPVK